MTDDYKIPELNLPSPDTLVFRSQGKAHSGNYILILFKIVFTIIILIFGIIQKQPLISILDNQSLSSSFYARFSVIIWIFLGILIIEIGRDIYTSSLMKYEDWDTIKFTQNRILLDSIQFDVKEITKINILAKLNWIAQETEDISRTLHIVLYLINKRPVILHDVYQTSGIWIPRDKIQEISKFCKNTYNIQPKSKFHPDYGMILLLIGVILAFIFFM